MSGIADTNRIARLYNHITHESQVFPSLGPGATVVSAAVNWTYGNYATVIGAGIVATPFHVHSVVIETMSKNDIFQLQIYSGATDAVVATVRFTVTGGFFGNVFEISSRLIPALDQVRARLACATGGGGAATATISVSFVTE
jgi:hypothetical protein